jgi:hypothetical protein
MAKTVPNFGQIVMAARNRYKWVSDLRLFVKIVTPVPGVHKVNIEPPTFKPPFSTEKGGIDWQSQEGVVNLLPALQRYLGRNQPHEFYIDDDGIEIQKPQSVVDLESEEAAAQLEDEPAPPTDEYLEPIAPAVEETDPSGVEVPTQEEEQSEGPKAEVTQKEAEDTPETPEPAPAEEAEGKPDPKEDNKPGGKGKNAVLRKNNKKEKSED